MKLRPIRISRGVKNPEDTYPDSMYTFSCAADWNNGSIYNGLVVFIQLDDTGTIIDYKMLDAASIKVHKMISNTVESYAKSIETYFKQIKLKLTIDQDFKCEDFDVKLQEV